MAPELIPRRALTRVEESLGAFRAVVIQGARQVGKSTVAEAVARASGTPVATLDRREDLAAALDDPGLFLESLGSPAVIDEIQRGGDDLVLAIKQRLDRDRTPGQYLLTGSTNFLTTPMISESLAGRIDVVTLWPLSMGELSAGKDDFVDRAFRSRSTCLKGGRLSASSCSRCVTCVLRGPAAWGRSFSGLSGSSSS